MSLRDAMRKAAGLIVELPPEPPQEQSEAEHEASSDLDDILARVDRAAQAQAAGEAESMRGGSTKTVEEIVRDSAGPNLDQIKVDSGGVPHDLPVEDIQPQKVYELAGLPPTPFTAEQMLEMLASLPAELPLDTKRQTVKVTLGALGKTMGATPETIVADASRKLAALDAYIENLSKQTESSVAQAENEIAALQAQIEEKRKAILTSKQKLVQLTQMCDDESHRLDDVLEFFSLDVPPSKYAASAGQGTGEQTASTPTGHSQT